MFSGSDSQTHQNWWIAKHNKALLTKQKQSKNNGSPEIRINKYKPKPSKISIERKSHHNKRVSTKKL